MSGERIAPVWVPMGSGLGLHRRLRDYADAHGSKPSVLIREWIELHVASAEEDRPILLADALRALAGLRPAERREAA